MKKLYLMFLLVLFSAITFAQYPEITIRDIQYQDPTTLINYFTDDQVSPYEGDTVTVTGVVMCAPYKSRFFSPDSVIMFVGTGAAGFYLQDTSQTDWSGILLRQDPSLGSPFSDLDSGFVVKVTGVVNEYSTSTQKTTQFNVINFSADDVIGIQERPQPVELTLDSLKVTGTDDNKAISEKWEGVYVVIRNVSTFDRNSSTGSFRIQDANGTKLSMGTKSDYFYSPVSGYVPPTDGSILNYIRGYIETRSAGSGGITINPAYPDDIEVGTFPPVISNITRDIVEVGYGQPVTITSFIRDIDGTVTSAKLKYRVNSSAVQEVDMTNISDSTFTAVIPAQSDSSIVDYFIWAIDNENNESQNPSDTSSNRYFYFVLDHPITIQHVQYSPYGSGFSAYNGFEVTVDGIVTSDTTDFASYIFIQNGNGPWSGIRVNGTETLVLRKGDLVEVRGTVGESFSMTQISGIDDPSQFNLISSGNPVPDASEISTSETGTFSSGTISAEQWEGVLVKYSNITVTDENADGNPGPTGNGSSNFGEIFIADPSGINTRVNLDDSQLSYHNFYDSSLVDQPIRLLVGDQFESLSGILLYTFGNYKLDPRSDDDFSGYIPVSVENQNNTLPEKFELSQNYPNPFNPTTIISFSIPKESKVTLKIFNVLGEEVKTLVNEFKSGGRYSVKFDASSLATGVYLYSISAGEFNQVRKMILIK